MEKTTLISNVTIVNPDHKFVGDLFLRNGKIERVGKNLRCDADKIIDGSFREWIVFPGYIDMHIHGSAGFDVMDANKKSIRGMARSLVKEGTTSFLATTMTQTVEAIENALGNISNFETSADEAEVLGIHLEGPYLSTRQAGAQPIEHIIEPSIEQFNHWQSISGNRIKQITIAPEVRNGFDLVKSLGEQGVIVSIGHSDATAVELERAVKLGAKQATHLYNQMRQFHHREPGVVGSILVDERIKAEIIVDLIHSHPHAVKIAYLIKKASGVILITDAMRAKGLPYGDYDLGGQIVHVTNEGAHLSTGALAGSILTMDQAVRNVQKCTGCSLQELVAMSSTNAAKQLSLSTKGYIAEGLDADLVILDKDLHIKKTICRGNIVFERK